MTDNPLTVIADNVRELAEGVSKLVQRITGLENDNKEIKNRLDKVEKSKSSGSETTE